MKKLLLGLLALTIPTALAGCAQSPMEAAWERSNVVKSCTDGSIITRDPKDGRLLYMRSRWDGGTMGYVDPALSPDEVCD